MYLPDNTLLQGGKYKIERFISSGGFGNTYEGVHTMMDTRVAIKEFFPKMFCNRDENTSHITVATQSNRELVDKLRKKFIEEAKAIFKMNHPNIVKVHDIFEENGTAYYVMDYIDGRSLGDIVKQRGALPESKAVGYIRQVADALRYVHSLNRLHLDIKPGNVMIESNGHAMLIDFGASKHYDMENGENTSTLMGVNTPGYAPVEQSTQSFTKFSPATDIYALGATLYKLLTGITPPDANLLMAREETLAPLPAAISASTRHAVLQAMTLIRADRPQSVEAFLSLLDSQTADGADDEVTVVVEDPARRRAEEERRRVEERKREEAARKAAEEAKRKAEEERKPTPKPGNGDVWKVWASIAAVFLIVAVGIGMAKHGGENTSAIVSDESSISYDSSTNTITFPDGSYKMVYVEGGTFKMGSNDSEADDDEKPVHDVTLSSYYIGQTEVTQALWKAVMGEKFSYFEGDNLPIECVSWYDCQTFIKKLNSLTNQNFCLPTEAQWEYAACGGQNSRGYKYSGTDNIDEVAWYGDNSSGKIHHVKSKAPNELGIYGMSGNVWEWCQDWYGNYSSSALTNPEGPASGSGRVLRGGSWYGNARRCRSTHRLNHAPDYKLYNLGLRLALSE